MQNIPGSCLGPQLIYLYFCLMHPRLFHKRVFNSFIPIQPYFTCIASKFKYTHDIILKQELG